ncbi:hypothetical protein QE152_g27433, partial [Popillia japonica]
MDVDETPVQDPQPTTSGASENLKQQAAEKVQPEKRQKQPPICFILNVGKHYQDFCSKLDVISRECFIQFTSDKTLVYFKHMNNYKQFITMYKGKLPFYTYTPKAGKMHAYIMKRLPEDVEPKDIKQELLELDKVHNVVKFHKTRYPIFMCTTTKEVAINEFITLPAKCANCGEDHPASSTQCKVYQNEIQKLQASRQRVSVSREPRASARESRYVPALPPPEARAASSHWTQSQPEQSQQTDRESCISEDSDNEDDPSSRQSSSSRRGMSRGMRDARLRGRDSSSLSQPQQGLSSNRRSNACVSFAGTPNKDQSDLNEIVTTMNEINAIVDLKKLSLNLKKLLQVKNAVPHLNMPWQFTNLTSIIMPLKLVIWNCNGISGKITE